MTSSATTKIVKDVILVNQATWEPWFNSIRASVKDHHWRFFDPERFDTFPEPLAPILPLSEQPPVAGIPSAGPSTRSTSAPGTVVKTPAQQAAQETRNERQLEAHYKAVSAYSQLKRDWEKIADAQSKLRDRIQSSVAQHKGSQLDADLSVCQWLQALKASTAPLIETIQQSIRVNYQRFVLVGYSDWPTRGPSNWVAKWEDLMHRAMKYSVTLDNWLNDVVHIWKRVPALSNYFFTVSTHIIQHKAHEYTVASVASDINRQWEFEKQGDNVKVSKPKTTRSAFTTQEASLVEEADEPATESTKTTEKSSKKKRGNGKRKRSTEDFAQGSSTNVSAATTTTSSSVAPYPQKQNKTDKCNACGGTGHKFSRCYLVRETPDKDWVDREVFDNNMKVPSFRKRVEKVRSAAKQAKSAAKIFQKADKE